MLKLGLITLTHPGLQLKQSRLSLQPLNVVLHMTLLEKRPASFGVKSRMLFFLN